MSGNVVLNKSKQKPTSKFILIGVMIIVVIIIAALCLESDISVVRDGSSYDYPDKTWGKVLDNNCEDTEWDCFEDDNGQTIVEFNGVVEDTGTDLYIQFEVKDDEFDTVNMEVDGESCSILEIAAVVTALFE